MKLPIRQLFAIAAVTLVLAACGGQPPASQPNEPPDGQSPTEAPSTAQNATQAPECLPVPMEKLQAIAQGSDDPPITPVSGAAVKSNDFESVYMIAMKFSAPGGPDEIGVWASNALDVEGGLIIAVDGFAQNFTHWPKGDETKFNITQADHGVSESEACLS